MVIIIIGLLAALVLPRVRVDNSKVDTAARTIGMALMVAQREAVARQHNVLLVVDGGAHSARTIWDANNNGIADAGERSRPFLLPEQVVLARPGHVPALGAEAEAPGSPLVIILQRNGAADRAHVLYLTTARAMSGNPHDELRAVQIARATGRPTWHVWTGTRWRRGA
jgi:type II secretory pathway pseudopilin PulG